MNLATKHYYFEVLPSGEQYVSLLTVMGTLASRMGFIMQGPRVAARLAPRGQELLKRLEPHLAIADEVDEWPGSKALTMRLPRLTYSMDSNMLDTVGELTSSLSQWRHYELPEDLHFLRSDGTTLMGSTTQDDVAWLELTRAEFTTWKRAASPRLQDALLLG